eukprot:gene20911-22964_t
MFGLPNHLPEEDANNIENNDLRKQREEQIERARKEVEKVQEDLAKLQREKDEAVRSSQEKSSGNGIRRSTKFQPVIRRAKLKIPISYLRNEDLTPWRPLKESLQVCKLNLPGFDIIPNRPAEARHWGRIPHGELIEQVSHAYEEVIKFRKNLFKVSSGKAGKDFTQELVFWLKQVNSKNSQLNSVAIKAFMILPSLVLQKPSSRSKTKENSEALKRRLELWKHGDIQLLLKEAKLIQRKIISLKKSRSMEDVSRIFSKLLMEGIISSALIFLDSDTSSGVLPSSEEVLNELQQKHPRGKQ